MKKQTLLLVILCLIWANFSVLASDYSKSDTKKVVKILAIGNSFSEDAVESYLYGLARDAGIDVVIGNLYIGGCSFETHAHNVAIDTPRYEYRRIGTDGIKVVEKGKRISETLRNENWDFISLQQASPYSGVYETYEKDMPSLYDYVVKNNANADTKYALHQTWAYAANSTHGGFRTYGNKQENMYNAICNAVKQAAKLRKFDFVIPAGTAIQNGRTSYIGDNFCRDGYHLDLKIGRYTAACTWFEKLFGKSVVGNRYAPEGLSASEIAVAQNAAHLAVKHPYKVTKMHKYMEGVKEVVFARSLYLFDDELYALLSAL